MTQRVVWTVEEVAALLGIGRTNCYELIRSGAIGHVRAGRRILVPKVVLDSYLGAVNERPAVGEDSS